MSSYEIALIIIGIVCIVVSCFLVDSNSTDTVDTELGTVTEQILYAQLADANQKISDHMEQLKEEVFEYTKNEMSRISNEKIMAVHEYSNQAIQDIKKNHDEVLFLYRMLTDKEEELKSSVAMMKQSMSAQIVENKKVTNQMEYVNDSGRDAVKERKNSKKAKNKVEELNPDSQTMKDIENEEFSSHIAEILELSNQGYSIVEISKKLSLGQGEVKLVLDYNKK